MDTNGDGLIDDPLATPKPRRGRKTIYHTEEERRAAHTRNQRERYRRIRDERDVLNLENVVFEANSFIKRAEEYAFRKYKDPDTAEEELDKLVSDYFISLVKDKGYRLKGVKPGVTLRGYKGIRLNRAKD